MTELIRKTLQEVIKLLVKGYWPNQITVEVYNFSLKAQEGDKFSRFLRSFLVMRTVLIQELSVTSPKLEIRVKFITASRMSFQSILPIPVEWVKINKIKIFRRGLDCL